MSREAQRPLELIIEKLVYGGDGLSRLDGRVALTPFVLPDEKVLAEVRQERPGLLRTSLVEVVSSSALRVVPPCPYFTRCGGCHYQHAPYEFQLAAKREILKETLQRIGKMEPPAGIEIVSGEPWSYRNRSQFHIAGRQIGYLQAGSHTLCPVEFCPISSPKINATLAILQRLLRDSRWPRFVRSLELFTNETDVQLNILETDRPVGRRFFDWCAEQIPGWAAGPLDYPAAGTLFRVSPRSFFQVNRFLPDPLVEAALNGAQGESALDLYAGVGLFSIPLSRRFPRVTSVESGRGAFRDLRFNAERAGVTIQSEQSTAEDFLNRLQQSPDFVLLDPPRAGLGKAVVSRLLDLRPRSITIVACDPTTLARDLQALLTAYQITRIILVDLFPQTFHMETIVTISSQL